VNQDGPGAHYHNMSIDSAITKTWASFSWKAEDGTPGRLVVEFVMAPADPDGVCLVEVLVSIAAAHLVECEPRIARRRLGLKKYTVRQARRVAVERTEIREISEVDSRNHPRAAFVKCWPECARAAKDILESLRNEVHSGLLPSTVVSVDLPSETSGSVAVRRLKEGEYTYNSLDLPIDRALEMLRREPAPSIEDVKSYGIRPARQFKKRWQWHRDEYFEIIVDFYALTGAHQVAYEVRTNSGYSETDYNYSEGGGAAPEPTGFGIEMEDTGSDEGVIGFPSKDADGAAVGVSPSAFHEAVTSRLKSILPGLLESAESFGYESGEPDLYNMKWVHGPDPAVREQIERDIDGIDTMELYAFVVGSRD